MNDDFIVAHRVRINCSIELKRSERYFSRALLLRPVRSLLTRKIYNIDNGHKISDEKGLARANESREPSSFFSLLCCGCRETAVGKTTSSLTHERMFFIRAQTRNHLIEIPIRRKNRQERIPESWNRKNAFDIRIYGQLKVFFEGGFEVIVMILVAEIITRNLLSAMLVLSNRHK